MTNATTTASALATVSTIECRTLATGLSYERLVELFERELGRLHPEVSAGLLRRQAPWIDVEQEIARVGGTRGLTIIQSVDQGRSHITLGPHEEVLALPRRQPGHCQSNPRDRTSARHCTSRFAYVCTTTEARRVR
jgi:hypothetical protein